MIETLNYINIFFIWGYILTLVWVVSRMEYDFRECISSLKYRNNPCYYYLMNNKYYLVAILAIFVLVVLSLGLLSQAYSGMIRIRTELTIMMSICTFFLTPVLIILLFSKIYKAKD